MGTSWQWFPWFSWEYRFLRTNDHSSWKLMATEGIWLHEFTLAERSKGNLIIKKWLGENLEKNNVFRCDDDDDDDDDFYCVSQPCAVNIQLIFPSWIIKSNHLPTARRHLSTGEGFSSRPWLVIPQCIASAYVSNSTLIAPSTSNSYNHCQP